MPQQPQQPQVPLKDQVARFIQENAEYVTPDTVAEQFGDQIDQLGMDPATFDSWVQSTREGAKVGKSMTEAAQAASTGERKKQEESWATAITSRMANFLSGAAPFTTPGNLANLAKGRPTLSTLLPLLGGTINAAVNPNAVSPENVGNVVATLAGRRSGGATGLGRGIAEGTAVGAAQNLVSPDRSLEGAALEGAAVGGPTGLISELFNIVRRSPVASQKKVKDAMLEETGFKPEDFSLAELETGATRRRVETGQRGERWLLEQEKQLPAQKAELDRQLSQTRGRMDRFASRLAPGPMFPGEASLPPPKYPKDVALFFREQAESIKKDWKYLDILTESEKKHKDLAARIAAIPAERRQSLEAIREGGGMLPWAQSKIDTIFSADFKQASATKARDQLRNFLDFATPTEKKYAQQIFMQRIMDQIGDPKTATVRTAYDRLKTSEPVLDVLFVPGAAKAIEKFARATDRIHELAGIHPAIALSTGASPRGLVRDMLQYVSPSNLVGMLMAKSTTSGTGNFAEWLYDLAHNRNIPAQQIPLLMKNEVIRRAREMSESEGPGRPQ